MATITEEMEGIVMLVGFEDRYSGVTKSYEAGLVNGNLGS
jgi:hypothetical protein